MQCLSEKPGIFTSGNGTPTAVAETVTIEPARKQNNRPFARL